VCRPSEGRVVALEVELVSAISFVGEALLTGSNGRGRGSRCSEVRWWRGGGEGVAAWSDGASRRWLRPSLRDRV
jgi:hypothetical protein